MRINCISGMDKLRDLYFNLKIIFGSWGSYSTEKFPYQSFGQWSSHTRPRFSCKRSRNRLVLRPHNGFYFHVGAHALDINSLSTVQEDKSFGSQVAQRPWVPSNLSPLLAHPVLLVHDSEHITPLYNTKHSVSLHCSLRKKIRPKLQPDSQSFL